MESEKRRWWEDERKALVAILLGALIVRLACALTTFVIHKDGARFTLMARLFAEGRWDEGLDVWPRMSPLYPLLILGFGSGTAMSMLLGTLAVIPIYFLAREVWDRKTAMLAALVAAFLPDAVRYGAEVMSEAPFMFFFFTAMLFVHRASTHGRLADFAMAGIAGGLATLTRPEGIYVLAAVVVWPLLRGVKPRRIGGIALAAIIFMVLISPYSQWIHGKTGRWDFADSPVMADVKHKLGLSPTPVVSAPIEKPSKPAPVAYALAWIRISGYALLPFLLLGLAGVKRDWGQAFVLAVGGAYAIPPFLNLAVGSWFSARFLLPAMVWLSPIVALGMLRVAGWVGRPRLSAALLGALLAALVAVEVRPNGLDRRTLGDAGAWIRANSASRPVLVSMDRRVDHYADGISEMAELRFDELQRQVTRINAEWVVIVPERLVGEEAACLEKIERAWTAAQVIPKSSRGEEVRIYRTR